MSRLARFAGVPLGIVFLIEVAYWIGRATMHLNCGAGRGGFDAGLVINAVREYVFHLS